MLVPNNFGYIDFGFMYCMDKINIFQNIFFLQKHENHTGLEKHDAEYPISIP